MSRMVALTLIDRCLTTLKDDSIDIYTKIARVTSNLEGIQEMVRKLDEKQ